MDTSYTLSPDGTRIAYDVTGTGPPLMLLHGGGQSRLGWHEVGYVERLADRFTVITVDLRGNGESDRPTEVAAYTTEKMGEDLLAVAGACGVEKFILWGFSYGGNVGRYLAARSTRVTGMIIIGIPFGPAADGDFRHYIEEQRARWEPILQAQRDGTLDLDTLTDREQDSLRRGNVPVILAALTAMLAWDAIEPADMRCPTLWVTGSKNRPTIASIRSYAAALEGTQVQVRFIEGLDHWQEFAEIDRILPALLNFTLSL